VLSVPRMVLTREVVIFRATGSTRGQIMRVCLLPGCIIGFLGSWFGLLGGFGLVAVFNSAASSMFTVQVENGLALSSVTLAVSTGLLAAVMPARRAAQYDPVEAIRYV